MDMIRLFSVVTIVFTLYSIKASAQEAQQATRCVETLLPCRPYIHSEIAPPQWCCDPMKEIAERNKTCLCDVFNHPEMLRLISLTQEDTLSLLKSCGANHDVSGCTNTAGSSSASRPNTMINAAITISLLGFSSVSAYMGL